MKIVSRVNYFVTSHLLIGNLNDGPKDGEDQAKKPTAAPFESQCMYSGSVTLNPLNPKEHPFDELNRLALHTVKSISHS